MATVPVPSIATATPTSSDTVLGVQGGVVKRFAVALLPNNALDPVTVSASRDLSDDDHAKTLSCDQAITLTIPAGLTTGFGCAIEQAGAGQVTVAAGVGVTLRNVDTQFKTYGQYAVVGLVNVASETYNLAGQTGA